MNQEQMNAAQELLVEWLAYPSELGKEPVKIEYAGEFDLHDLHYYIFKYKKSILGKWYLGVSGGYEGDGLEYCGHVFSEMREYIEETAKDDAIKIVEMIRSYWMDQAKNAESNKDNINFDIMNEPGVLQQDFSESIRPGMVFVMQLLMKEKCRIPKIEQMTATMKKYFGNVECFCYEENAAGFAIKKYMAELKDACLPPQLIITGCIASANEKINELQRSQMWSCQEKRDRILSECKYQVVATDMLAAGLPAQDRADMLMDYMEALIELYPDCEAIYFQNAENLILADQIRNHKINREDRFLNFAVNVRFFNIQGGDDKLVDTLGMSTLQLPDLQYHFHGMDPNWVVNHAYNVASYIFDNHNPIAEGNTVDGIAEGNLDSDIQWQCHYEDALIEPARPVIDICMNEYASGSRK